MEKSSKIKSWKTDSLSRYKTLHYFESYGEIKTLDDYNYFLDWANLHRKKIYFVGNGSNTLFVKKRIKSLVIKNCMPKEIKCLSEEENIFEISSNVMVMEVLKLCLKNSLDSFYYLSSVPAKIGGALAMNAGMGRNSKKTIYDFVESVTFIDKDNSIKEMKKEDMKLEHRKTVFTGCQNKFIISAKFRFPQKDFDNINPIKERIKWAKENQDNTAANCGSVFKESSIIDLFKGFKIGKAEYSSKCGNWINNRTSSVTPILVLLYITKFVHIVLRKKYKLEVICVR